MKVWISKYALTGGIEESDCRRSSFGDECVYRLDGWQSLKLGRDAHETKAGAVTAAEAMRLKKIAALQKQIAKLEAMRFEA